MNPNGNPESLELARAGNTHAARHGAYSPRLLAPRAREVADALMEAPHTVDLDRVAAEEIGALVALLEAVDRDLLERGMTNKRGEARTLLDIRLRASGRLERWLREFGLTPAARAEWAARLAGGGLAAEIARRRDSGVESARPPA